MINNIGIQPGEVYEIYNFGLKYNTYVCYIDYTSQIISTTTFWRLHTNLSKCIANYSFMDIDISFETFQYYKATLIKNHPLSKKLGILYSEPP